MRLARLAVLLGLTQVTSSLAQQPNDPPIKITLSAPSSAVVQGSEVRIRIELANLYKSDIGCTGEIVDGADLSYRYEIRGPDDQPIPNRVSNTPELDEDGKFVFCTLAPGKTFVEDVELALRYDMTRPGTYSIRVSRFNETDPKGPRIQSNALAITITAPQGGR